jgi:alpha-1,2-mannosyltransferase
VGAQPERMRRIAIVFAALVVLLFAAKVAQTLIERADAPVADLVSYFDGAQRLRAGLPLYRPDFNLLRDGAYQFIYPPPVALLLLPFPTYRAAWWAWAACSLIFWLAALAILLATLAEPLRARVSRVWMPVLIAALINFPPVQSHLFWGQTQLLLLLLLTGCWWCLRTGRDGAAGALLGLAIATKVFPLLLLGPLVLQRRWRCVAVAGLTAAAVLAGGFALAGWEQGWFYLTRVLPDVERALGQNSPGNNSIASMLRNAGLGAGAADTTSLLIRLAILGAVALGAWRVRRDPARAFALGMTTLALVPPVIWEHYFVLLYLPWLDALARMRGRQAPALIGAYFLIATASLAYHTPPSVLAAVQLLPLSGALLLLGCQLWQARDGSIVAAEPQEAGAYV